MPIPAALFEFLLVVLRPASEYVQGFTVAPDARFAGVRLGTLATFACVGACLLAYRFLFPLRGAMRTRPARYVLLLTLPQVATLLVVANNRALTIQSVGTGVLLAVVTYLARCLYEGRVSRYARLVAALAIVSAAYAAGEYVSSGAIDEFNRVDGLWGGAFKLSNIGLVTFLLLWWRYVSDERVDLLQVLGLIASVFCMAVSGHRAGLLLAGALGLAMLVAGGRLDRGLPHGRSAGKAFVLIGVALAAGIVLSAQAGLLERYRALWQSGLEYYFRPDLQFADPAADRATASSMLWRVMVLMSAISESRSSPATLLFGHGERSIVGYAGTGLFGEFEVEDPGSSYAWMLFNFGLLKVLAFGWVCWRLMRDGRRAWSQPRGSRGSRLAGFAVMTIGLTLPALSLTETVFHDNLIGLYFWSAIGVYYAAFDPAWMVVRKTAPESSSLLPAGGAA